MTVDADIRDLIDRLAKLHTAAGWDGDLNPTQRAVVGYLGRANRFSRSPSHVSDYLGTTRGTTTQSLKSLAQKGYVTEQRSSQDKRVISYTLTEAGQEVAEAASPLQTALSSLSSGDQTALHAALTTTLKQVLVENEGREFGLCGSCIHHKSRDGNPFCGLLDVALERSEADQICHEHVSA